jgi:hypothetical protein
MKPKLINNINIKETRLLQQINQRSLLKFLFNNKNVFAWSANDLCGVNRDVIEYSLNVDLAIRPRKQKLRKMFDDKAEGA